MEQSMTPLVSQAENLVAETLPLTEFAGFWRRFAATVIDGLILWTGLAIICTVLVLSFLPTIKAMGHQPQPINPWIIWPFMLSIYIVECIGISGFWLYYALQEAGPHQATLGKRAMGLIVTDVNGYPINFGRATGRYFATMLSDMTLGIGYIMAGFTPKKQALHDMVANTLVLRYVSNAEGRPEPTSNQ